MTTEIEIFQKKKEKNFPIVKLTKSVNGKTGTATFLFLNPSSFQDFFKEKEPLEKVSLLHNGKKIQSKDIEIIFNNGKPVLLKTIFIFKNSKEWFQFLHFMNGYSKDKGLIFKYDGL
jgi:photosystem II protein